jgi:DNA-binding MarR family transcriptional regulator
MSPFQLDQSFGYNINRAAHRLEYELLQAFKRGGHDITPQQWAVLNRLWEQDGLSQVEIADRTFKDRPVITRIVDILERKGVVVRRPDAQDRRVIRVYLTPKGKTYQETLVPLAEEALKRGRAGISEEELAVMTAALRKIIANLE